MLGLAHFVVLVALQLTATTSQATGGAEVTLVSAWERRYASYQPEASVSNWSGLDLELELKGEAVAGATHFGKVRIDRALDDRGNTLRARRSWMGRGNSLADFVPLDRVAVMMGGDCDKSVSGTHVQLSLSLPARDATKLVEVVGALTLRTGGLETVIVENVKLRAGEQIDDPVLKAHGVMLVIQGVSGESEMREAGEVVSLELSGNGDRVVAFGLTKANREMPIFAMGHSTSRHPDCTVYSLTTIDALPEDAALKVAISSSDEELEVPFSFKNVRLPGSSAEKTPQGTAYLHVTDAGTVPVVHNMRFDHPPLTDAQVEALLTRAQRCCPDGQQPWFIYVVANWKEPEGRRPAATVYFTPGDAAGRVRKGKFECGGVSEAELAKIRKALGAEEAREAARGACEYWQVSRRDEPFTEEVDVPDVGILPFPRPIDFTENEVVELIDFIRTNPERDNCAVAFDGSQPILSITRSDDVITVRTGTIEAMLAGRGQLLTCKRRVDGTFEVLSIGIWVS